MNPRPANLLIYGDVASFDGALDDYKLFRELIKPIENAGIKWEVAMGNHDRINNFRQIFPEKFVEEQPVEGRYVNIVEIPRADFILLDSYLEDKVPGWLSPEQKDWLTETLKGYSDKPFFVGCHHPIHETKIGGLLKQAPKFVSYIYGHDHYYRTLIQEDLHTICIPSTGFWGDLGFVMAHFSEKEVVFVPHILDYEWAKWGYVKEPEKDVESYMKALNANVLTLALP